MTRRTHRSDKWRPITPAEERIITAALRVGSDEIMTFVDRVNRNVALLRAIRAVLRERGKK
jgi:hypothetical protein